MTSGNKQRFTAPPVVCMISLGCPKNTVDTERILGALVENGWLVAEDPEDADVALVNTCGFLEEARRESAAVVRELAGLKGCTRLRAVVAVGCMIERAAPGLQEALSGADLLIGFEGYCRLPESQVYEDPAFHF